MLIYVIGVKGGVGTTSLAQHLARSLNGVGLDLADGQLAARLGRSALRLSRIAFARTARRRRAVDSVVGRRHTMLWSPECRLKPDETLDFIQAVADRTDVVADAGIEQPASSMTNGAPMDWGTQADVVIVVTGVETDDDGNVTGKTPVVKYHERALTQRFPGAMVTPYSREAAQEIAEQLL